MKIIKVITLTIMAVFLASACEEKVDSPSPNFYIEVNDPNEGIVKLQEPFQVNLGETFTIIADNDADFNSFWPGDVVITDEDTIIREYVENLTIKHQGVKLGVDDRQATYAYKNTGDFTYTFVSVNTNAGASTIDIATKSGTITVLE